SANTSTLRFRTLRPAPRNRRWRIRETRRREPAPARTLRWQRRCDGRVQDECAFGLRSQGDGESLPAFTSDLLLCHGTNAANLAHQEIEIMWLIIAILLVLWVLGLVTKYTLGGFLHILL